MPGTRIQAADSQPEKRSNNVRHAEREKQERKLMREKGKKVPRQNIKKKTGRSKS